VNSGPEGWAQFDRGRLFSAAATDVCLLAAAQAESITSMQEHQEQEAEGERHMFSVDDRIAARREQAEPDENAQEKATPAGDAYADA
jgi:hypothetical protein